MKQPPMVENGERVDGCDQKAALTMFNTKLHITPIGMFAFSFLEHFCGIDKWTKVVCSCVIMQIWKALASLNMAFIQTDYCTLCCNQNGLWHHIFPGVIMEWWTQLHILICVFVLSINEVMLKHNSHLFPATQLPPPPSKCHSWHVRCILNVWDASQQQ